MFKGKLCVLTVYACSPGSIPYWGPQAILLDCKVAAILRNGLGQMKHFLLLLRVQALKKRKCCFTNKGLSCVKYTVHVVIFLEMLSAHTSTVFIGCVHYFHQVEILKPIPSVSSKFGHRCEKK